MLREELAGRLEKAEERLAKAKARERELLDDIGKIRAELRQEIDRKSQVEHSSHHIERLLMNARNFALYRLSVSADDGTKGRVLFTSPSFQRITGVPNPADQNSWFEVVHPDDIQYMLENQEKALETGIFDVTYRTFHPDHNEWRWLHAYCSCDFEADGEVKFFNGFIEDITERKRTEIALDLTQKKSKQQMLNYQKRLQKLTQRQFDSEQRESLRITEILHDNIGQDLSLVLFKLNQAREEKGQNGLGPMLNEVSSLIEQAISYTRSLTKELCPPALCQMGVAAGIEWLANRTHEQFGIESKVEINGFIDNLDDELGIVLFRIVAELLNNTAKHANAHAVSVKVTQTDSQLTLVVEDDGIGFDYSNGEIFTSDGFGLFMISERLRARGGIISIKSAAGQGTKIGAIVPVAD